MKDGDGPDSAHGLPRYRLRFEIPQRRPGLYTFVIYSEDSRRGKGGSLIVDPDVRLRIRAPLAHIERTASNSHPAG